MDSLKPIIQIFCYPKGLRQSIDDDSSIKVHENVDELKKEITSIQEEITRISSRGMQGFHLEFEPAALTSADGKSVQIGSLQISNRISRVWIDLSYEEYEGGITSISISSCDDIDDFNDLVNPKDGKIKNEAYRLLAKKLFEQFNSQLAISYINAGWRISNTKGNLERLETTPYALIESEDLGISPTKSTSWRDGYYEVSDGDSPLSFRSSENQMHSREVTCLLQKLGLVKLRQCSELKRCLDKPGFWMIVLISIFCAGCGQQTSGTVQGALLMKTKSEPFNGYSVDSFDLMDDEGMVSMDPDEFGRARDSVDGSIRDFDLKLRSRPAYLVARVIKDEKLHHFEVFLLDDSKKKRGILEPVTATIDEVTPRKIDELYQSQKGRSDEHFTRIEMN